MAAVPVAKEPRDLGCWADSEGSLQPSRQGLGPSESGAWRLWACLSRCPPPTVRRTTGARARPRLPFHRCHCRLRSVPVNVSRRRELRLPRCALEGSSVPTGRQGTGGLGPR